MTPGHQQPCYWSISIEFSMLDLEGVNLLWPSEVIWHLGQHRFRLWLVAWWHQAKTWTNADISSVRSLGMYFSVISLKKINIFIQGMLLKMLSAKWCFRVWCIKNFCFNTDIILWKCIDPKQHSETKVVNCTDNVQFQSELKFFSQQRNVHVTKPYLRIVT